MISVTTRSSRTLAVVGLGASGRAAAHALLRGGADVAAWDDDAGARAAAAAENLPLADPAGLDWPAVDSLVLSPGIPLTHPAPHPAVALATAAGRPVIGDVELFAEACPAATLIAITGTNGKSTTSALIHHVLKAAGEAVQIGGNFGPPVLGLEPPAAGDPVVLEVSSYQLDLTQAACFDIAVLLNITPDHLDRHGDMAGYVAAKTRIFRGAGGARPQVAVIGVDDARCRAIRDTLRADGGWRIVPISVAAPLDGGVYVRDGMLVDAADGDHLEVIDLSGMETLRGTHNWQNAAAAFAVARARGIAAEAIAAAFATFPGLPHRLEAVGTLDGIRYVNDSKATNGEAAARALASFETIYWIAGGVAKEDGLDPAAPWLGRVRHAFLIGAAEDRFAAFLDGRVPLSRCGTLDAALRAARARAGADGIAGAVVLLSPACASFDQFRNFAARGDAFRRMVADMIAEAAP